MFADDRVRRVLAVAGLVGVLLVGSRFIPARSDAASGSPRGRAVTAQDGPRPDTAGGYRPAAASGSVVHVAGAVAHPGVYRLRAGARVRDAVQRAGGPSGRANLEAINLAALVTDGQQVVVPRRVSAASAGAAGAAGESGSQPVSLGSATAEQLDGLDGVGPAIAKKIVDWRSQHGGFGSVDDLDQVPGIGPKKLEALRGQLTP